jgi:hypothetical protein
MDAKGPIWVTSHVPVNLSLDIVSQLAPSYPGWQVHTPCLQFSPYAQFTDLQASCLHDTIVVAMDAIIVMQKANPDIFKFLLIVVDDYPT